MMEGILLLNEEKSEMDRSSGFFSSFLAFSSSQKVEKGKKK
jgi:hypothetical protein